MHILVLADDYPSEGRPSFVFVQQLVHALLEMGVKITVVAQQSLVHAIVRHQKLLPRKTVVKLSNDCVYNVYRPYSFTFGNKGGKLSTFFYFFNQLGVEKVLKIERPTVLYGHFWHSARKLSKYAIMKNKPLFVACGEGDNAMEALVSSLSTESFNRLFNSVLGVISVSTENKRKCVEYGLSKLDDIIVLPNCSDETKFYSVEKEKRKEIRLRLGLSENDFFVLFVGGLIPRKGANRLSRAIDKLGDSHIKSAFIGKAIAGKDSLPSCEGIVFMGTLNHDELPDYYRAADVFVLPTLNEGCSNAIIEALSCGTPVISSNRPFNADILNDFNSILVNPESVDEIAEAIELMRTDKVLYQQKKAYTMAHSGDFSIRTRARRVYRFICDKSQNS